MPEFRVANLMEDGLLLALAHKEARSWVEREADYEKLIAALSAFAGGGGHAGLATVG
jgi:hypothetical protein